MSVQQLQGLPQTSGSRPAVSVYWTPGCSSCLKAKEFLEEMNIRFESVNVLEREDAMNDLMARGFRSAPVVRNGDRYIYAQSLDDVAQLLGVARNHKRLSPAALMNRWEDVLGLSEEIVSNFSEALLGRQAIAVRENAVLGTVMELAAHVFDIADVWQTVIAEQSAGNRSGTATKQSPWAFGAAPDHEGMAFSAGKDGGPRATKAELVAYMGKMRHKLGSWRETGGENKIPDRIMMYYGDQPSGIVLERYVWHSTQHARQLDHIAVGMGNEFTIPPEVYAGLPLPKRIWE